MKKRLEVYNDEFIDSTKIFVDSKLVYESKRVKSLIQLDRILQDLKEDKVEYETITHNYTFA